MSLISQNNQGDSIRFDLREVINDAGEDALPYASDAVTEGGGGRVIANFISGGLRIAILIASIALLGFLIIGALEWITAGGDKGKIDKARSRITNSVIGILLLSAVIAIFVLIQNFLGVSLIQFEGGAGGGSSTGNNSGSGGNVSAMCPCRVNAGDPQTYARIDARSPGLGSANPATGQQNPTCFVCTSGGWQDIGGTCPNSRAVCSLL